MKETFVHFLKSIVNQHDKARYLLAVSGGIDSMAMLNLYKAAGFDFAVANIDFQLRGHESTNDSLMVKDFCQANAIEFFHQKFDTQAFAKSKKVSIQMAARTLRYQWFEELLNEYQFDFVAIGQHLDDQSESFFINLIRGTGIAGMHGIAKNANRIIRPLLFATRTQIEEYVASENIGFREDSSNASDKYQRNYIRHHILPHFNHLRPDFSATLNQSLEHLSEIEQYALKHLDKQCNELIINEHDGSFGIARKQLHAIAFPKLILFHILKDYGFQHSHIENILRLLQDEGNGKRVENTSHRVWIDRDKIIVQQKEIALEIAEQLNDLNSDKWHQNQLETEFPYQGDYKVQDSKLAFLDYDKLQFPLEIRNWKQGDTFTPLGMKGKKKISDFIIDQKLDIIAKQQLQVLCSSGKIVWIIGQRIDQHFAIGGKTKNILKITYYGHS